MPLLAPVTGTNQLASDFVNVAVRLTEIALKMPEAVAVVETRRNRWPSNPWAKRQYRAVSFEWLDRDSTAISAGLRQFGITEEMRIALLVRPGIDFVSLVFGLLKTGVVQVLIDPGMGLRHTVAALCEVQPQGFIAVPQGHLMRGLWHRRFRDARFNVTVGRRPMFGPTLDKIRRAGHELQSAGGADREHQDRFASCNYFHQRQHWSSKRRVVSARQFRSTGLRNSRFLRN